MGCEFSAKSLIKIQINLAKSINLKFSHGKIRLRPRPAQAETYLNPIKIPQSQNVTLQNDDSFSGELQKKLIEKYSSECHALHIKLPIDGFIEKILDQPLYNNSSNMHSRLHSENMGNTTAPHNFQPENLLLNSTSRNIKTSTMAKIPIKRAQAIFLVRKLHNRRKTISETPKIYSQRIIGKTRINFTAATPNSNNNGLKIPMLPFYAKRFFSTNKRERRFNESPTKYSFVNNSQNLVNLLNLPLKKIFAKRKEIVNPLILKNMRITKKIAEFSGIHKL